MDWMAFSGWLQDVQYFKDNGIHFAADIPLPEGLLAPSDDQEDGIEAQPPGLKKQQRWTELGLNTVR